MKKNDKGFSAVEGLLLVVIVAVIGFVGWYVWHSKQNTNKSFSAASNLNNTLPAAKSPMKTPTPVTDASSEWTKFSSFNNKFSLIIPDGWTIYVSQARDSIYVADSASGADELKVTQGTKPTVIKDDLKRGGTLPFTATLADSDSSTGNPNGTATDEGTISGIKVTRYEIHPTQSLPDEAQPGDVEYYYKFEGTKFYIDYIQRKGIESHLTDIEKVVKSVELHL